MTGFVIFFHTIACILLVVVILMQTGRGGGLTEGFASAESMLGAQTNAFMNRLTTVLAVVFFVTSLGLAFLSSQKGKSLISDAVTEEQTAGRSIAETVAALEEEAESSADQMNTAVTGAVEEAEENAKEQMQAIESGVSGERQNP